METCGIATASTQSSVPAAAPHLCEIALANLQGATGFFSGAAIDSALACTEADDRSCQIMDHLSTWNEILFQIGVEAVEQPRTHAGLTVSGIRTTHAIDHGPEAQHRAFTLLYLLVKNHRCVKELDLKIPISTPHDKLLREALRHNGHIEILKLGESVCLGDCTPDKMGDCNYFPILPSLSNLKRLECGCSKLPPSCLEALTALLRTTSTLECLNISCVRKIDVDDPKEFFVALTACPSLKKLSLDPEVFEHAPPHCCRVFSRYLANTSTLKAFSFIGNWELDTGSIKAILRGVCENKSIVELKLTEVTMYQKDVEIIAALFTENTTLRSVHISPLAACFFVPDRYCDSWLGALAENNALEELTLPLNVWHPQQWRAFFGMLATKRRLKRVAIAWTGRERTTTDFHELCSVLRESGVEEKVPFEHFINPFCFNDNFTALRCKIFVHIATYTGDDGKAAPHPMRLVRELTTLSHTTELSLYITPHQWNKKLSCAIADYIGTTTALKSLRLEFRRGDYVVDDVPQCWRTITESLSRNQSISSLEIGTYSMGPEEMEYLSEAIRCSENIREFCDCFSNAPGVPSDAFLERLSRGIANNYSLVRVLFSAHLDRHAFDVRDTARRNLSLVARASRFRQQSDLQRCTAGALEKVWRHRALLHELADVLSMSVDEATTAVRASCRSFEGMNAFMRLAGIVRVGVECYPSRDGRAQLDDLDVYCWRALRRYLMLDDVVTQARQA